MMMEEHSDADDPNGDGEGVWSSEIEQCFHEALMLFPPCGRRKHILQEEGGGKMYGRNELIARHIKMKTGKVRTRKQVSSHIQVLARRKAKAENSMEGGDTGTVSSASPASSISVSVSGPGTRDTQIKLPNQQQLSDDLNHYFQHQHHNNHQHHNAQQQLQQQHLQQQQQQQQHLQHHHQQHLMTNAYLDVWNDRPIVTNKIRLVEFSAFIEYRHTRLQPPPRVNNLNAAIVGTANSPVASAISLSNLAGTTPSNNNQTSNITNAKSMESAHGLLAPTFNGVASTLAQHQPHQSVGPLHHPAPQHQHHLPEHYNQYQQANTGVQLHQPLNNNHQQQHHQINQRNNNNNTTTAAYMPATNNVAPIGLNYQQQAASTLALATAATTPTTTTSAGSIRHSYVKIDYRQPICRQINKLERIDISQIQDKFPEITDRLYQRGPSDAFFLVKFWADLNNDYEYNNEDQNSFFGFSCNFETLQPYKDITCSTKACSYGLQVVEKVEKIHGALNNTNGRYTYDIDRSPMCDFMKQFIKKLRQLPMTSQMNSVLENFSVLQVITSESTSEILLCLAFVFEIASTEPSNRCHHHVYKLTKD